MRKIFNKKALAMMAALLISSMAVTGCGKKSSDSGDRKVVATVEGQEVYMDVATAYAISSKLNYEAYYSYYYGDSDSSMWTTEIEDGITLESYVKDEAMNQIIQTKIILSHQGDYDVTLTDEEVADIEEQAKTYIEETADQALLDAGVDVDIVKEIYTENALVDKIYYAATADVDAASQVSDEDARAASLKVFYIETSEEGTTGTVSQATAVARAQDIVARVQAGEDFDAVASEYGYSSSDTTLCKGDLGTTTEEVGLALETDEVGYSEEENCVYVMYCTNSNDETATEENRQSLIDDILYQAFSAIYDEWEASAVYEVDQDLWNSITFASEDSTTEETTAAEGATDESTLAEETTAASK